MQPDIFGKYELLEKIGRGSTADVWLAKDNLGRQVALKIIEAALNDPDEYLQEARTLDRLRHPNIVHVNGADHIDGKIVIDMEFVRGQSLKQRVATKQPLPLDEALIIVSHVLNALAFAHENHFLHRDIKPDNIFLTTDGSAKLGDFGNARPFVTDMYMGGGGTYPYMAPEAFTDVENCDRRSDLWSVGVLLYQMLTGQLPFWAGANNQYSWRKMFETVEKPKPLSDFLPNTPNGLQGIVSFALAPDKSKRFQTADAFLDALKRNGFYHLPNTEAELRLIHRFEAAYNRIDKYLRQEAGTDRKAGFAEVVRQYGQQNRSWRDQDDLLRLAQLRNKLRHDLTDANQYRFPPDVRETAKIDAIEASLTGASVSENQSQAPRVEAPLNAPEVNVVLYRNGADALREVNGTAHAQQTDLKPSQREHEVLTESKPSRQSPAVVIEPVEASPNTPPVGQATADSRLQAASSLYELAEKDQLFAPSTDSASQQSTNKIADEVSSQSTVVVSRNKGKVRLPLHWIYEWTGTFAFVSFAAAIFSAVMLGVDWGLTKLGLFTTNTFWGDPLPNSLSPVGLFTVCLAPAGLVSSVLWIVDALIGLHHKSKFFSWSYILVGGLGSWLLFYFSVPLSIVATTTRLPALHLTDIISSSELSTHNLSEYFAAAEVIWLVLGCVLIVAAVIKRGVDIKSIRRRS